MAAGVGTVPLEAAAAIQCGSQHLRPVGEGTRQNRIGGTEQRRNRAEALPEINRQIDQWLKEAEREQPKWLKAM